MKNLYILFTLLISLGILNAQNQVTFEVNTAMITVGPNGMYLGGGYFADSNAHQMSTSGDGIYTVTVNMPNTVDMGDKSQNYIFFNSPNGAVDWNSKENLDGQSCGDPDKFNDRTLPTIAGDMTIKHCFNSCEIDGTCPPPNVPSNAITTYSESFETGVGVFVGADQAVVTHNTNGYLTISNTNKDWYSHLRANVSPMDLSSGTKGISLRVKGPRPSKVMLKIQDGDNHANNYAAAQLTNNYTDVGNWQTITWDMSAWDNAYGTYMTAVVFFFDIETDYDANVDASQNTFNVDNFQFGEFATLSDHRVKLIKDVSLYPNPVRDVVNISAGESIQRVRVYDLTGRMVKQANPNTADFSLDVADLSKGVYFVKLNAGDREATTKLIK